MENIVHLLILQVEGAGMLEAGKGQWGRTPFQIMALPLPLAQPGLGDYEKKKLKYLLMKNVGL